MISSVRGKVLHVGATEAEISVDGLGLSINATASALSSLREGEEGMLYTTLVVRQDSLALFGFASPDERATYLALQSVSGIGAKLALAVLSTLSPNDLRRAVEAKDTARLQRVPGVGKKSAQRMILELATKLGPAAPEEGVASETSGAAIADVVVALTGLGWGETEAHAAVTEAAEAHPDGTVAQLLRESLRVLGRRK
ncbi:Holliday junction branch migration protein RuvA [Neoactinobaculum massilliense]|uniref:Holliday junction branch migration protein RuvA n=1 Tax=Neoactinobaculum massilliense TaxID=2364794 RepID=UPI000F531477|nr:Holliday junction branch migration protein RuvA [Neoactinobaculum massilliense]